ncbi:hypothetical protein IZY60_03120 [Lutibacter sp. B2]|nr:hypothetical protein [Lutibacter sp. B2]
MKKVSVFLSVLILFMTLLIPLEEAYAFSNLDVSIEAGFDLKCKSGGINPVKVIVESKEKEVKGNVKINVDGRIYTHHVDLGPNAKKELLFSIPIFKENEDIIVEFENNGEVLESKTISPDILGEDTILAGILSDTPENIYYLEELKNYVPSNKNVEVINLDKDMKYSLKEIDNFNFIVVDNFNTENLLPESQKTIKSWISKGNSVLIGANKYDYKTLTGIFEGIKDTKQIGDGYIIPVKGDLENSDIEFIKNTIEKYITPTALSKVLQGNDLKGKIQDSKNLYPAVEHLLKSSYNSVFCLIAFLVIYFIFMGVAIYLGKNKWLFTSVIMSLFVLFYVFALWGGFQKSKVVGADIKIYNNGITSYSLSTIYPYKQSQVSVHVKDALYIDDVNSDEYSINPIEQKINYTSVTEDSPLSFYSEGFKDCKIQNMKVKLNEDVLSGEITNILTDKMYNCFLVVGDTVVNIGNLDGKEKIDINEKLNHNLRNLGDYNYLENIYKTTQMKEYQKQMFEYYFYHVKDYSYEAKLIGFSKEDSNIEINEKKQKSKKLSCNVFDVQIENDKEKTYMPAGMIKPIVDYGNNEKSEEKNEYILEEGKEITVYYSMPKNTKVENLKIYAKADSSDIYLEAFKNNRWVLLTSSELNEESLKSYISKGIFILRIKGNGRIIIPQIEIMAGDENA